MKHARWRNRAVIVLVVTLVAAGAFLLNMPVSVDLPTHDRDGSSEGGARDRDVGVGNDSAASTRGHAAGLAPAGPDTAVIPPGLPPVDPVDPPEYATNLPADTLYAPNAQARAYFADKLPFGVDDREYVEFNRSALGALDIGSTLTLRTPDDGKQHTVHIDEIQVHPNGDKSWVGHVLDAAGEVLPVVFTQGVDSSFGSVTTRSGTYSMEAEGRLGWIANVNRLRQHQDFDQVDVMVPGPDARTPPRQP